ncbi:MAG: serine/threonine-protein kinase, partial [Melioribacteraceae bacterium]
MNDNYTEKKFEKFIIISCYKKDEHSAVYLAEHIYLDKKVILKVLNVKTLSDETRIDRFKREAKILAKLEHTNIIKVFDFGIYKDYFYISFEYFESDNLREVFNKGELAIEQKENLFVQMLRGLNYAHQKGIIHRDIKPENILVNKNFKLKITDFGLALPEFENFLTKQYSLLGTPAYMSPEQIKGEKLAHKSDLFSLGIVTYELFKGKNPFLGKDVNECVNNILSLDEKNLSKNIETIPQPINKILVKLLSKDISLRFQSATEVLSELDAIEGMTFVNNGHHKNRKPLKYLVPIGLLLLFGFIFTFYSLIFTPNITDDNSHLNTKEFAEENKSKVIIKKESEENILTKEKQELNIENILKNSSNEIKLENSKKKIIDIEKLSTNKMLEVNEFGTLFV